MDRKYDNVEHTDLILKSGTVRSLFWERLSKYYDEVYIANIPEEEKKQKMIEVLRSIWLDAYPNMEIITKMYAASKAEKWNEVNQLTEELKKLKEVRRHEREMGIRSN